jgi:energy-coupling factor transport system substrate-specific component
MIPPIKNQAKGGITIRELCIFPMLGALMFCSKLLMELLPNIHLIGMFIMVFTLVYRKKALIPIYIFVFITGVYGGFAPWWVPYLYIWTVLWALTLLLPKKLSKKWAMVIYPVICSLHGFAYGILYAPAQALIFGFNLTQTIAWVASGFYFDILHGIGNFVAGLLILPLSELLTKLNKK